MTTPLGSAVAPDVKMISAVSSRVTDARSTVPVALQSSWSRRHTAAPEPSSEDASTSSPISTSRDLTIAATRRRKSADAR